MRDRERHEKRVGTVVDGRWRVDALLGWGSTSAVYRATHRNGHRAALKILHRALCADEALRQKFSSEAGIANSIRHRAIVPVNDDGTTEDGCAYLVLDLLEGETLEEIRALNGGRIPLEELAPLVEELMSGLAAVHAAGIIHRDLKPQNVFRTTKGELKLLDFGSARIFDTAPGAVSASGIVKGTPAFMSPEQARGDRAEVDVQSDVWSVGATLFTMLSGEYVHLGRDAHARLLAAASHPARKLGDVAPSIDDRVATVIDRALFRDKSERWPDVRTMRIAFRQAVMTAVPTMRDLSVVASTMMPPPLEEETESIAGSVSVSEPNLVAAQESPLSPSARGGIATPMALTSRIPPPPRTSLRPLDRESEFDLGVAATRGDVSTHAKRGIPPIALLAGASAMAAVLTLVVFFKSGGDASTGHTSAAVETPPSETATPAPSSTGSGFIVIEAPDDPAAIAARKKKELPAWATAPMPAVFKKDKEPATSVPTAATSPAETSTNTVTAATAASDAGPTTAPASTTSTSEEPVKSAPAEPAAAAGSKTSEPAPAETDAK